MPSVGELVGDRYRLVERIASGGMGDVWQAVDETLDRCVAVKMLHPRLVADAGFGERFRREARAMAALRHPGVAQVYDYGEVSRPGVPVLAYIVMECVQGQPLSERIAEVGRLDPAEALSVAAQTARALQAAHDAGLVHRDVKPQNLIIEPDGHVVLVDFGVAVTQEAASLTAANQVVGTALYMAPEQVSRNETTPAIDIYALGAVVHHCLAGSPPYEGDNAVAVALRHLEEEPPPLPEDVPAEVRQLVTTAMAKDPTHRFPTAAAMGDAAQALADSPHRQGMVVTGVAATGPQTVHLAGLQPALSGAAAASGGASARKSSRVGRGNTALAVLLGSLAAVAAVLAFAAPIGGMPSPTGRPSAPPAVPSTQGEPSPGTGGGGLVTGSSAGVPVRAPESAAPTATRPAPARTAIRPGPANGSGAPRPTTTGSGSPGPTAAPTGEPTADPTGEPTADPTADPTGEPTADPTADPTGEPTADPTADPTGEPTADPTAEPSEEPGAEESAVAGSAAPRG